MAGTSPRKSEEIKPPFRGGAITPWWLPARARASRPFGMIAGTSVGLQTSPTFFPSEHRHACRVPGTVLDSKKTQLADPGSCVFSSCGLNTNASITVQLTRTSVPAQRGPGQGGGGRKAPAQEGRQPGPWRVPREPAGAPLE